MFDSEARVLIGWLVRVFASQPIGTRGSKSNIFVFMFNLRRPTFLTANIYLVFFLILFLVNAQNATIVFEKMAKINHGKSFSFTVNIKHTPTQKCTNISLPKPSQVCRTPHGTSDSFLR